MNPTNTKALQPITVAIADDHTLFRESFTLLIEGADDISVAISAANGRQLIDAIARAAQPPQVCLVDIMMPEMDGFASVQYIKKNWPQIKVLVLTGYLRDAYIIQMICAGADGYISKASSGSNVQEAIRHVTEYGIYCNELFCLKDIKAIREGKKKLPDLTEKEMQLLRYCVEELTYPEIARLMKATPKAVEGYRSKLFQKLGVKTKTGLTMFAIRFGYVAVDYDAPRIIGSAGSL